MNLDELTPEQREKSASPAARTAGEAGWRISRYNVSAKLPDSKNAAIANLFKGTCAEYTPLELYLMSVLEELDEGHPIIERLARRGVIVNFDERAALEAMGRGACARSGGAGLTICPTMGCNFDCPYCFENHSPGKMGADVQDDVVALAGRLLDVSGAKSLSVTWFGGEPLLAPDVIESLSARLMALSQERGAEYSASIITNGYLLTQGMCDMLGRARVKGAQVTIDGLGATHDATRRLAGGGPTFERIVGNLRECAIPFKVAVRHNVHEANKHEVGALEEFVGRLAEESGNDISYYPALVTGSEAAEARGGQVGLLCGTDKSGIGVRQEAGRFHAGRGSFCMAHYLWSVGIDARGRLYKCWEAVDKPSLSFGAARDWDPEDPLATAGDPDKLTMFLNTACPIPDDECRECVWLPLCAGGCPYKRLTSGRDCVAFKDDPEPYVLALHARIGESKGENAA